MGQLVDGQWHDVWYDTKTTGGAFKRTTAAFRNWITADGSAGPSGEAGFPAQSIPQIAAVVVRTWPARPQSFVPVLEQGSCPTFRAHAHILRKADGGSNRLVMIR